MTAREYELLAQHINPGGWSAGSDRPLTTLLGSCVAVCLYDPQVKLGGMNHFLLPSKHGNVTSDTEVILAGDFAMEVLVNALMKKGASKARLVAKAFGGGNVVSSIRMAIGDRNAQFAAAWLNSERIPLVASDFGGPWSRKVVFVPQSGEAFCRRSPVGQSNAEVVSAEAAYEASLVSATPRKIDYF